MTSGRCELCDGGCAGADLATLLQPQLAWVWQAVADAADRRGDPDMIHGAGVSVTVPADAASRAAAAGLFAGRTLAPGQLKRLDPAVLAAVVRARLPGVSPGTVAAHAVGRRLAARAAARSARDARIESLRATLTDACDADQLLHGLGEALFEHLRRSGWVARLDRLEDPPGLVRRAVHVAGQVRRIPEGERRDRRTLVPENPHALDDGTPLAGLVLALLTGLGVIPAVLGNARQSWAQAGVDCDELQGGLTTLGVHPAGWTIPAGTTCTIPPRELKACDWLGPPAPGSWLFVTENPSILAAAADAVARLPGPHGRVRLVCTMGTPSGAEIEAIGRLAGRGWRIGVRADFDTAGIRHVTALLAGIPGAAPWRMGAGDYLAALSPSAPVRTSSTPPPATPWDPELATLMAAHGQDVYEEALLPELLADLAGWDRRSSPMRYAGRLPTLVGRTSGGRLAAGPATPHTERNAR